MAKKTKPKKVSAAPKRERAERPPRLPGQGSPALIIALVFMVLTSLILGVLLYMDKDKLNTAKAEAETKKKEAETATKELTDIEKYIQSKLLSWLSPESATQEDFGRIRDFEAAFKDKGSQGGYALHKWFQETARSKIEGNPDAPSELDKRGIIGPYNRTAGKPESTLEGRFRQLVTEKADLEKKLKETTAGLGKVQEEFKNWKTQYSEKTQGEAVLAARKKWEEDEQKIRQAKQEEIEKYRKNQEALNVEFARILEEEKKKNADEVSKIKGVFEEKERAVIKKEKDLTAAFQARELIHLDEPRGKIVQVEPGRQLVHVDIGSAHRARPQLTFSVYGVDIGGKAKPEPKAKIEIVNVESARSSLAKVTQMAKPAGRRWPNADPGTDAYWYTDPKDFWRSPVLVRGDLIYNPAWDPQHQISVALAGIFDLDGDGKDDAETFQRLLKELGVSVTAYVEPTSPPVVKGRLDYQTDYLVIGGMPVRFGPEKDAGEGSEGGLSGDLIVKVNELEEDALKKGIQIVGLRRFLARIGYSAIRVPTKARGVPATAPATNGKAEPAPKAEEPAKEEAPKDEAPKKEAPKKDAPKKEQQEKEDK